MPFSFLKHGKGDALGGNQQIHRNDSPKNGTAGGGGGGGAEKVQRRQSKRNYLRSLLRINSHSSKARSDRRQSGHPGEPGTPQMVQVPTPKSSAPTSPMNKPLPPPPGPGTKAEPAAKASIRLERIISPIAPADLRRIFSGAPHFFARAEGHCTGAPHPLVVFPWNAKLEIRDISDHVRIEHEAWRCVTAWPHLTAQASRSKELTEEQEEKHRAHFIPRCRERPSMLSMQGIERGSMGFQAALESEVADALQVPQEGRDGSPEAISEHRKTFLNGKDGLRPITDATLIDRLMGVGELYHEDPLQNHRPTVELYTELFTQILYPPLRVTDSEDPYSLQVQIESLVDVLRADMVFVDFSLVEWRIRLGQILWGTSSDSEPEDELSINNEAIHDPGTQRYWLLVQILLSCELLVRLDALCAEMAARNEVPGVSEERKFDQLATTSVRWSLILARSWLENIKIDQPDPMAIQEKKPAGWLATLTGTANPEKVLNDVLLGLKFRGRHQKRQLSGLLHFARELDWPGLETLMAKVSSNGILISDSIPSSPGIPGVATPLTMSSHRSSSYFGHPRPIPRRCLSVQKSMSATIHPAGWLSNSYISGLVLPGEGLSHFLISTLLEHDSEAVARLGEEANLYGGFVYRGKSFWSLACIVGRVLAAEKRSSECMGWVSSSVLPLGAGEGWVDIDIEAVGKETSGVQKPRLLRKGSIEHDGNVIGGADISSVLPGDFILPSDEVIQPSVAVVFESLDLFSVDSHHTTPTEDRPSPFSEESFSPRIKTYSAMMRFMIELGEGGAEQKREVNVALNHDVRFVSAHPCVPSTHTEISKTPVSPGVQVQASSEKPASPGGYTTGHPLHKAFTYTKISLPNLVYKASAAPWASLLSPSPSPEAGQSTTHTTSSSIPRVLVVDCTRNVKSPSLDVQRQRSSDGVARKEVAKDSCKGRGSDSEVLARALCAERGWDAVVSRTGRGCLACAIREAYALGLRVVLRVPREGEGEE